MISEQGDLRVPHPIVVLHGQEVTLACAPNGSMSENLPHGLFAGDTRVLSSYQIAISGYDWKLLGRSVVNSSSKIWIYQNPILNDPPGAIPAGSLLLILRRTLDGTLHEDLEIHSFAKRLLNFRLTLKIDSDFSDIFEVRDDRIWARLNVCQTPRQDGFSLSYDRTGFHRGLEARFGTEHFPPTFQGTLAVFDVSLFPKSVWKATLDAVPVLDRIRATPFKRALPRLDRSVLSSAGILRRPYERGVRDLDDLTVERENQPQYLAAGVPWFLTLFGRDALVASIMSSFSGTARLNGALSALIPLQARERDDWRDAEPGKLPHEVRVGELTTMGALPFSPYYGGHDIPALYCLGLWNSWRWNGDRSFLKKHLPTAQRALHWCETLGDRDGDGFLEYGTRSQQGYRNQSWKDSGDAIVHVDGSFPKLPVATVELQGYYYAALHAMSELLAVVEEHAEAARLKELAFKLRESVEDQFWMEDLGYYAMGLDGDKRQIKSISSNPGHLLWCGLPNPERALKTATHLMGEGLFSGWGLRTLTSSHTAYNPLSYQLGSVWPHDTALAAAGLQRYGASEHFHQLSHSLLGAARQFESERLPELFGGVSRSEGLPIPYERANIPQAWAAASPILTAQLFLGLVPDAPETRCYLNPHLPDWLPELEVTNICIGQAKLSIKLSRRDGHTIVESHECSHKLEVIVGTKEAPLWGAPLRPGQALS